ncbi:hypothetical protein SDC9_147762 [bioreactor metagenome]|uniref:Uncharacterized protein n=1 Tax=bioreactor metagenome TaxID=1076179 RepID=A0A645EGJ5_9ZZZZ
MRHFGIEVFQCPFGADSRKGKFDLDFLSRFRFEVEVGLQFSATHFREIVFLVKLTPETAINQLFFIAGPVIFNGLGKDHGKIEVIGPRPSAGDAVACHQCVVVYPYL